MLRRVGAEPIIILSHTAQFGGGEVALTRLLAALDRGRFAPRAVLFADGPLRERLAELDVPSVVLPLGRLASVTRDEAGSAAGLTARAAGGAAFVARLARLLRTEAPALAVANTLKSATLLAAAAPLARTPWAWHLHDRLADDYLPRRTAAVMRAIARRAPRQLVANSSATLRALGPIDPARVSIAFPGLGPEAFRDPVSTRRTTQTAPVVGILGRISATKGQLEFARAAETVLARFPHARFRIIGAALFADGPYEQRLRHELAARQLEGAVELAGWSSDPASALRELDLVVHASPVPEPFGQVVVEAMAAGVPVVATDAGGIPEILDPEGVATSLADGVRESPLGLLVRPGDADALARAVAAALESPDRRREAAERARASAAQRFTSERTARAVEAAWTRALHPRR